MTYVASYQFHIMLKLLCCVSIPTGDTVLHVAVRNGNIETIKLLITCGTDINKPQQVSG